MSTEFRPATRAVVPLLRELTFLALYVAPGESPFPRSILDRPELRHYYDGFGSREGDLGVVVAVGPTPKGAAWCRCFDPGDPGYGWVGAGIPELVIAVDGAERGRGLGTTLLDALFAVAAKHGYPQLSLSVDPGSPAVRLYERCGFRPVGSDGSSITMVATTRRVPAS